MLNYLKKIEDIDGKDSNSGNKYDPVHVSACKKTGKVQNKHNYRQDIDNIKKHLRYTPKDLNIWFLLYVPILSQNITIKPTLCINKETKFRYLLFSNTIFACYK